MNKPVLDAAEIAFEDTLEFEYPESTYSRQVIALRDLDEGVQRAVRYAFDVLGSGEEHFCGKIDEVECVTMNYCSELSIDPVAYANWLRSGGNVLVQVSEGTCGDLLDPEGKPIEGLGALVVVVIRNIGVRASNRFNPSKRKPNSTFFLDIADKPETKSIYAGYSGRDPDNIKLVRLEKSMGYTGFQRELHAAYLKGVEQ